MTINHQDTKTLRDSIPVHTNNVAKQVVDAAFIVHSRLGPGLLESVYELCLTHELTKRKMKVQRQVCLPVVYDNLRLDSGLRFDMYVGRRVFGR
jgi:GxxExxY protein